MIKTYNQSNHQNMNNGDDDDEEYDDLAEIHDGIINGDLNMLHQALKAGADPNEKFTDYIDSQHSDMTPLALAAALNKAQAIKMLLEFKANVNDTFASLKTTALMTASFHGHSDVVRQLILHKADVNAVDLQGSTALGYAFGGTKSMDVISQLLKAGIDVNSKNMLGMNGLLLVAGYSNDALVRMVIDAGADPCSTNDYLHTALHIVVVGKWSQIRGITQGRLDNYGLNRKNIGQLMKDWARSHRELIRNQFDDQKLDKVGQFMVDIGNKYRDFEGMREDEDDQEAMKKRIEAVWHYRESRGYAAAKKSSAKTSGKKSSGVMNNLLSCGGKRSKQAKLDDDAAPLDRLDSRVVEAYPRDVQLAIDDVSDKCARILRMIIDAGCDVERVEKTFGMTALDMAIVFGDIESTVILMSAGGDPFHLLKMFALSDLHDGIVSLDKKKVKDALNDPDIDVNGEFSPFHNSANTEAANISSSGRTPLALAAQLADVGVLDIMKMLCAKGAEVNKSGLSGSTPMAEAARLGNVKMAEFLSTQNASVEIPSPAYRGATPISVAAANRKPEVVKYLIDKEAKVDKRDLDGRTSVICAANNGDREMVEVLLGANLLSNFSDRSALAYELAKRYQKPDRDFNSIMNAIDDECQRLRAVGDTQPRVASTRQQPTATANNSRYNNYNNNDPFKQAVPPPGESSEEDSPSPPRGQSKYSQPIQQPQARKPTVKKPETESDESEEEVIVKQPSSSNRQVNKQPLPVKQQMINKKQEETDSEESSDEEESPKFVQQNQKTKPKTQPQQKQPIQQIKKPPESESEDSEEESEDDTPMPPRSQQPQKSAPIQQQQQKIVQQQPVSKSNQAKKPPESEEDSEEESEDESPKKPIQVQRPNAPAASLKIVPQAASHQPQKVLPSQPKNLQQQVESSSEEESSEEEAPPPIVHRQPVLPSQKIESQFNKMSVNPGVKVAARPTVAAPPLPSSRPPQEEDSEEETDSSDDEDARPSTVVKAQQPNTKIPVVIKGKVGPPTAAKTTTTKLIQPDGQTTQNVTRTMVTKTFVTTNQQARVAAPAVIESDDDDDDDDDDDETDI